MNDFFDRLDKYMEYSGLNDNQLTVLAQLSVGALGKQRKGGRGLSVDSIAKILSICPDLNAKWLMTGKDDMLSDANRSGVTVANNVGIEHIFSRYEELVRENERLVIRINELERTQKDEK